jgi:hypothetical protein
VWRQQEKEANMVRASRVMALLAAALSAAVSSALAQSNPQFVRLAPAMGALYKPDSGPAPHVGLIIIHRTANYLSHPGCTELAKRGFIVLCMAPRFEQFREPLRLRGEVDQCAILEIARTGIHEPE